MVGLIDARSPEVYKLLTANKLSDTSPISAEMWTEHFQFRLCNHKRALLTCYLEDPTNLHGIIYSVTSYDLDKFLLLTLQFHPALVAGTGAWTLPFNAAISKHLYTKSSPGFDPFSTSFIKHAEKKIQDDRGKRHTENVLLPLLTDDLFHLFMSDGINPHLWNRVKITPLHKKGPTTSPTTSPKIIVCWLSMVVSIDFLQTWSGTCW